MRIKLTILLIAASMSANAALSEEELCTLETESGFEIAMAGVSEFLSSSNPALRHSQIDSQNTLIRDRLRELPRLDGVVRSNRSKPITDNKVIFSDTGVSQPTRSFGYQPVAEPQTERLIQPQVTANIVPEARLSPKTESLFNVIPKGIGANSTAPQKITLNKESFIIPQLEDDFVDDGEGFEEINLPVEEEELTEPFKLEIEVFDTKPQKDVHELHSTALKALNVGQYESSVAIYKKLLRSNAKDREALFGLATAYHQAGERKKARNAYSKLLKYYPKFEDGINNFINLASAEAPEHALKELIELQKTSPEFASIYAQKGLIYSKLGDKKQAIKNTAYALKLDQNNNTYKYNLAILLDEVEKFEYAAQLYKELVGASYRGEVVPVGRKNLEERMAYIVAKIQK